MSNPDVVRSDDPDVIRTDIERTRRELGQDVDALADKVNPGKMAQRQTDKVRRAATRLKDRVMGTASDVVDSTQEAVGQAGEAVADAPRRVASATQGNPVAVGLIAFGVGWLLSSLVPASRPERDMADKLETAAAPLVDEVKAVAKESADNLREPAREAVDAVKERAAEAMDTVKVEGADAASEVQTEAKHAAERQME
jgi:ElaB/YqjD/DUF883 family membrane-anchored ribosome-binding protein